MDNNLSSQSVNISKFNFKPKRIHLIFLSLVVLAVILTIALIVVIRISPQEVAQKPQYKKPENIVVAKPVIPLKSYNKKLQEGPFHCPTIASICLNGTYEGNSLIGDLPNNSPVFASFDGLVEGLLSFHPNKDNTKEEFYLVLLTNKTRGLMAYYSLKGKVIGKKEVKEGEQIATSNGQAIKFKDNKSFIFEMVKIGESGATRTTLSKNNFK